MDSCIPPPRGDNVNISLDPMHLFFKIWWNRFEIHNSVALGTFTLCAANHHHPDPRSPCPSHVHVHNWDTMELYPRTISWLMFLLTISWMHFLLFFCNIIFNVCLVFYCKKGHNCSWAFGLFPLFGAGVAILHNVMIDICLFCTDVNHDIQIQKWSCWIEGHQHVQC